jgi:hypothetical protein
MFQPGMEVYHKSDVRKLRLATLVSHDTKRKAWKISMGGHVGYWYESNLIPIVDTNEEAVVLLNKTDTF